MSVGAAKFRIELARAGKALEDATVRTVQDEFIGAYRDVAGLAPVDTGAHRVAEAFKGKPSGARIVRHPEDQWAHPGDGPARQVAAGFRLGDTIGMIDIAVTPRGVTYGQWIQPPADRPIFGFGAGSKPAISKQAPRGDYAVVWKELDREFFPALEGAIREELEAIG